VADPSHTEKIHPETGRRPTRVGLSGAVRASGLVRMEGPEIAEFRRRPSPIPEGWSPIPPTLLKASDEQTVAGVAAILAAVAGLGPVAAGEFADWGIVAAPRFPGRAQLTVALDRFAAEGVWGVSPHLIPHFALHSQAGTLSLALKIHGPNLGIGGGSDSAIQGILTALTWLDEGTLPGVWLVLSGYTPEFVPGPRDASTEAPECRALALALVPRQSAGERGPRLRIVAGDSAGPERPIDLIALAERLRPATEPAAGRAVPASSPIYRPHLKFPTRRGWPVAADPVAGLRVELDADTERGGS
jgi:hypothetical protein